MSMPFIWQKAIRSVALLRAAGRFGVVEDLGMCVSSLYGNREISRLAISNVTRAALVRVGKVRSRSR
jgi:hypothetical protein